MERDELEFVRAGLSRYPEALRAVATFEAMLDASIRDALHRTATRPQLALASRPDLQRSRTRDANITTVMLPYYSVFATLAGRSPVAPDIVRRLELAVAWREGKAEAYSTVWAGKTYLPLQPPPGARVKVRKEGAYAKFVLPFPEDVADLASVFEELLDAVKEALGSLDSVTLSGAGADAAPSAEPASG